MIHLRGTYTITPAGLSSDHRYHISDIVSGTLTIDPAVLTISGLTAKNKAYDGTTIAMLGGVPVIAPVSGNDVKLVMQTWGVFDTPAVGKGKPVALNGFSISGSDAGNYHLVLSELVADINPVPDSGMISFVQGAMSSGGKQGWPLMLMALEHTDLFLNGLRLCYAPTLIAGAGEK